MPTYSYDLVPVWDATPGGAVRTLRNARFTVRHPTTNASLASVTSDASGHVTFTAATATVYLEAPGGFRQLAASLDGAAYRFWLAQGNTGTEADFLAAITGPAGPPGSISNLAADGEASSTKPPRSDDARLTSRAIQLMKAGTSTDTRTAVGARIPFRAPFPTNKFRVHLRNRNPQAGTVYTGALNGTAIGIGTAQTTGETVFAGIVETTSSVIQGSFTTPADGSEYVTGWKTDFPLTGGVWYHLSYGYNGSAQTNYAGDGVAWTNTSPTSVLNKSAFSSKVATAPLDVWIEAIPQGGTAPVAVYAGQVPAAPTVVTYPITKSSRTLISTFGDSLTDGGSNGTLWPETDSWPSKLALQLPGTTVTNLGYSSACVDEMLIRTGVRRPRFTVVGGSIPSSGTVNLTTTENLGIPTSRVAGIDGVLGGFTGRLLVDASGTGITFTTYGAAPTTAVTGPQEFVSLDDTGRWGDTAIVWIGRNDVTFGMAGVDGTVPLHVVGGVQRLVEWLTPQVKQIMIVGTTTQTNETTGQTRHTQVTEINTRLRDLYPGKFKSVQEYLMTQAMTDMGLTQTSQDTTNLANGTLPESLMAAGDVGHISKATAAALAQYFFAPYLLAKGWV